MGYVGAGAFLVLLATAFVLQNKNRLLVFSILFCCGILAGLEFVHGALAGEITPAQLMLLPSSLSLLLLGQRIKDEWKNRKGSPAFYQIKGHVRRKVEPGKSKAT